jgi:pimeloyl-ACP methyl ester carboxylesterase
LESWAKDPEADGRLETLKHYRMVKVPGAGHWVHHDQLEVFLRETESFLVD